MEIEKLYRFIHSLSKIEKANFSKMVRGKKKTDAILLYDRILTCKKLDESGRKRIRGKEFQSSQKYYSYRIALTEQLIWSLAAGKKNTNPVLAFVELAFLLDFPLIAEKALFAEMQRLQDLDSIAELELFHDFIHRFEQDYRLLIEKPAAILSREAITESSVDRKTLESLITQIGASLSYSREKRLEVGNEIVAKLKTKYRSISNEYLRLKVLMNHAFLTEQYERAFTLGEQLITALQSAPDINPPSKIATEMAIIGMNSLLLGKRERATRYAIDIGRLDSEYPLEKRMLLSRKLHLGAAVAVNFAEKELAENLMCELTDEQHSINPLRTLHQLFAFGLAFFFNEEFEKSTDCFEEVRKRVPKGEPIYRWEPHLLSAIGYLEMGDIDKSLSLIRAASRSVAKLNGQFPSRSVRIIKDYLDSPEAERRTFSKKGLTEIRALLEMPDEKRSSFKCPIHIWLEAKFKNVSQKEIVMANARRQAAPQLILQIA